MSASRLHTALAAAFVPLALCVAAQPAHAQSVRVTAESENFRAEPRGEIIATLPAGTTLEGPSREAGWVRATLRGWVWAESVGSAGRAARLSVTPEAGENLRATPNGTVIGRLNQGTVLTELERQGGWVRVERTGWIWGRSVEDGPAGRPAPAGAQPSPSGAQPSPSAQPAAPSAQPAATPPRGALSAADHWLRAGASGTALLQSPAGDTIARVRPMTAMEVVASEGNWARVRIEGWVWQPGLGAAGDTSAVLRDVSAAVLGANPENFRGRTVEWRLQFISLERAERIRTDFYEGEPFILARGPGDENAFVYVAVPPDRVAQVERLGPLERITVLGRVRTGRSRVMGAPVLDLLELRRE